MHSESPEEYYRRCQKVADGLNSGAVSGISESLKPIIDIGAQNGGVRCVEIDAYSKCPHHVIMNKPLPIAASECLALGDGVESFHSDYDFHFTLPDLVCFQCIATGDIVSFPRFHNWRSRPGRT